ncbi:MAG TPA: hypothetical protein VL282_07510 [Tepidisphaeraceae bacterium]|jgi:hypothetical protein|nr:hypothetical protein [Tepidisphaeraceae bacterium]
MPDSAIATAADYADALITTRRAKNVIVLILLLILLAQLAIFILVRRQPDLITPQGANITATVTVESTTQPATQSTIVTKTGRYFEYLEYLVALSDFLGVTLTIVLSFLLFLLITSMLVGRLIGVARVTSAFIWCLVLMVLLFPWQAFLGSLSYGTTDFKIPGVLYTWDELRMHANFASGASAESILKWARFVAFPIISVLILLAIQIKSNRGLRQALGEADYPTDVTIRT